MISYAPFEVEEPQVTVTPQPIVSRQKIPEVQVMNEGTECNYLIFVFIAGLLYILSSGE